ncbi:MAG TPA: hypothetical protein PLU30_22105 [Verrucomicrobiae bacterium]|nr:hypothetical protein [Verrucomicrobiae bacterium]
MALNKQHRQWPFDWVRHASILGRTRGPLGFFAALDSPFVLSLSKDGLDGAARSAPNAA